MPYMLRYRLTPVVLWPYLLTGGTSFIPYAPRRFWMQEEKMEPDQSLVYSIARMWKDKDELT